jgi:hypothetical protein
VSILTQLADGLAYLHRHQFIPRDLNPSKVMFDDAGRAKWCDLVLANPLFAGQELFARWTLHGTPAYISPEQARGHGEADVRANLYSLGALAFEMLVGRPPFVKATDMDTIAAHLTEPVPDPRLLVRISPETAALVQQLLAKDPADRFPSAAELLAVLRAPREAAQPLAQPKFITLKPGPPRATVPAPPVTAPPVAKPPASRRALWELLGWAALIAAVIAIVWWQLHRSSAPAARQPVPAVAPAPVPVPPRPPPVKVGSPVAVSNRTAAGRTIQQPGYEAVVADDGCLTNLRLAGLEFLKPGVNISRGTYFHQNGALKLPAITEPAGNVIAASGDKAAVRYEFAPSNLAWQVTNKTGAPMQFFIIFDPAVNTVMNENGEVAKPAVKKNWSHTIWFRGAARLEITGGSKLWGPWAGPYQVWEASLGPKETRTIRLTIGQRTADEAAKIAQLHGNR